MDQELTMKHLCLFDEPLEPTTFESLIAKFLEAATLVHLGVQCELCALNETWFFIHPFINPARTDTAAEKGCRDDKVDTSVRSAVSLQTTRHCDDSRIRRTKDDGIFKSDKR